VRIRKDMEARAGMVRGLFDFRGQKKIKEKRFDTEITEDTESAEKRAKRNEDSARGEREDEEIAFAGDDDGEGAAVWSDGEIAEAEAVKDGNGLGLRHGNVMPR
jgi:hypothetical protein